MAQRKGISTGTTAQRSIEEAGKLRFNTTTSLLEYYDGTTWKAIDAPPIVSSVSPSSFASDGSSTPTITISGSGFSNTIDSVKFIGNDGTEYTSATVTRDSATQVTAQVTTAMTVANEPYDVKVTNSSGLAGTLADALDAGGSPTFVTAAGSLGTISDINRGSTTLSITITDPDSTGTISTSISSGSLPAGASISSAQTPGQTILSISGFSAVGSNTTSTFTIEATDGANTSSREYTITVNAPTSQSFTSSGTFSVPSGVTTVNVLVVAGGGAGHGTYHGAGGGAGGLIYRPGFPVTPGGTVSVTVGSGGTHPHSSAGSGPASDPGRGEQSSQLGQDSVFGTLTAKGGGRGGGNPSAFTNLSGGSGGGTGQHHLPAGGTGTQPTQPGDSGTYGFGNPGGTANTPGSWTSAGGGGGAGAAGGSVSQPAPGSPETAVGAGSGGIGKAYTIADGTTSVYYAGGGGGSAGRWPAVGAGGQGGGGSGSPGRGEDGTANRGGGGGGGERNSLGDYPGAFGQPGGSQTNFDGGSGGKGIVIVQY